MTRKYARLSRCPNCQGRLGPHDDFCPACGQENHDLKVPFKHLFLEALEGFLHVDGRSYRTARALVFKPGYLTSEFRIGRRASYVTPVRLYVFISFVFFLVLSFTSKERYDGVTGQEAGQDTLNISFYTLSSQELAGLSEIQIDSVLAAHDLDLTALNRYVARQLGRAASSSKAEFEHMLIRGISYMMFVLMPFLALLSYLFHRKSGEYYLNCLVFSIHFHSFVFLLFTLVILLGRFVHSIFLTTGPLLLLGLYFWLSLRTVYRQKWLITSLKTITIGILHLVAIVGTFILMVFISVLLI